VKENDKIYLPLESDNESNLWLSINVEGSVLLGISLGGNHGLISLSVLVVILFSILSSDLSSSGSILFGLDSRFLECFKYLSVSFLLLKNVFWDNPGSELQRIACVRQILTLFLPSKNA
jgi:hypothetical protein